MSGTTTSPNRSTPDQLHAALLADGLPEELADQLRDGYAEALANLTPSQLHEWVQVVLRELGSHDSQRKLNTFIALHCQPSEHEGRYPSDETNVSDSKTHQQEV